MLTLYVTDYLSPPQKTLKCKQLSVVSLYDDGAELEHVSEMNPVIKMELAGMLDKPLKGGKGWRDLASELGYQYEIKGRTE